MPGAGATIRRLIGIQNIERHAFQGLGADIRRRHPLGQHHRHRLECRHVFFYLINDRFRAEGQQLDKQPPRRLHGQIGIHQNPQGADGGGLLADRIVLGNILRDFAGNQGGTAHIGLCPARVPHDIEHPLGPYGPADVQLAIRLQRDFHHRIGRVAPRVPLTVRHGHHRAGRAVAAELQGH